MHARSFQLGILHVSRQALGTSALASSAARAVEDAVHLEHAVHVPLGGVRRRALVEPEPVRRHVNLLIQNPPIAHRDRVPPAGG
eukprot:7294313-Prymnesium_polylepis.1